MKIASIIHTYLQPVDISLVVNTLKSQTLPADTTHEIIVVENGLPISQQANFPGVTFLTSEKYIGMSQGLNLGIKQALQSEVDFVWLTDPFIVPMPDMLTQFLQAVNTYKDCLAFTPKIYTDNSIKIISSAGYVTDWTNLTFSPRGLGEADQQVFDRDLEVDYAPLNQLFIKSKAWSEVGLFDNRYFADFTAINLYTKIRAKGYRINLISLAHAIQASGKITWPADADTYYSLRDKIFYSLNYAPVMTKLTDLKLALDKYLHGDTWEKKAVKDVFSANLGVGSYTWS
mgnify:FL=1